MLGAVSKFVSEGVTSHLAEITGAPGLVASMDGDVIAVMTAEVGDGLIQALFIVTNPDKLRAMGRPVEQTSRRRP